MAWTVRNVLKKPGGDPLYEFFTTYSHQNKGLLKDPRILSINIWRNLDRSIGMIFITWENQASYNQWKIDNNVEHDDSISEAKQWASNRNIQMMRQLPQSENQNWADPQYVVDGTLGFNRVTLEQIVSGE